MCWDCWVVKRRLQSLIPNCCKFILLQLWCSHNPDKCECWTEGRGCLLSVESFICFSHKTIQRQNWRIGLKSDNKTSNSQKDNKNDKHNSNSNSDKETLSYKSFALFLYFVERKPEVAVVKYKEKSRRKCKVFHGIFFYVFMECWLGLQQELWRHMELSAETESYKLKTELIIKAVDLLKPFQV